MMILTPMEKSFVLAAVTQLIDATKDENAKVAFADNYLRIKELEELDEPSTKFLALVVDKVIERVEILKKSPVTNSEASLRAEALETVYVGIKRKIDEQSKR